MSKLSIATIIATLIANANFNLEDYVKKDLIKNPNIKVKGVELVEKKEVKDHKDWTAYMFLMNLEIKGKTDNYPETVFVNEKENLVSMDLYDYKTHKLLKKDLRPALTKDYYNKEHLIAGKESAKHKLVVFSDPQCPFCQKYIPKMYETVKKNPDTFALYYYHMPLKRIHPVSDTLTKVMEVLQKEGKIDEAMKMYNLKIDYREKNATKILNAVNKQFNLNISKEQIENPKVVKAVEEDIKKATRMMIKGTPTVYLDGKFDPEVTSYKKLLKK